MRQRIDVTDFRDWLLRVLEERGISQSELARRAGLSRAAISDIVSGRRGIGKNAATSIARALKLPPEEVFRAAGILPPNPKDDPWVKDMMHKLDQLHPAQRKVAEWLIKKLAEDEAEES